MRKLAAPLFIGLGAFLLVVAVVAQAWAADRLQRTPLDTDSTTLLSGEAQVGGPDQPTGPVRAWSINRADSEASDDDVVVWSTSLCVVRDIDGIDGCVDVEDPQERLISATAEAFATDRRTGVTVENGDYLPAETPQQEGLQNKWPFGAEKKTYPVWDDMVRGAVDATFEGTEDFDGLETYHYRAEASATGVEVTSGLQGSYEATTDYYIEPRTGTIIKQVVHQERAADGVGPILVMDLAFTDEQVQKNVDETKANVSRLGLITDTVPMVGYVVGGVALAVGVLLILRRRGSTDA